MGGRLTALASLMRSCTSEAWPEPSIDMAETHKALPVEGRTGDESWFDYQEGPSRAQSRADNTITLSRKGQAVRARWRDRGELPN